MPSKDERRAELEAELAALDADDDDSDEVTISHEGRSFTGSWRRATKVAESWGFKLLPEPPASDDDPAGKGKGKPGGGEVKRFVSGRRVG